VARTFKEKMSLLTQAREIERRVDSRLVSATALERARKALERSKWSREQKELERAHSGGPPSPGKRR
jgi:hypothetical protein